MFANLMKSFFVLFFISNIIFSQKFGTWENFSAMREISDIHADESGIWSATKGGMFYYNFSDSSFILFNKSTLSNIEFSVNQVTAITIDNYGKVWAGNQNGFIYVFDQANNNFRRIGDINISEKTRKQITDFEVKGDTIFAATEFGVSLINTQNFSFYDSYFKLGNLATDVKVNDIFFNGDQLVLSTEAGIVIQKPGAANLNNPDSWATYTIINGLLSNNVFRTINFQDQLIAFSDLGLRKFENGLWIEFIPELNRVPVFDALIIDNKLYILTQNQIYSFENNALNLIAENYGLKKLAFTNGGFYAASNHSLIEINSGREISPNGPKANLFADMTTDNNGTLWVASGTDVSGVGFYKFDGSTWQNFDLSTNPEIRSNAIWRVHAAPDNTIYFGNWGQGFIRVRNNEITSFSAENTDMAGISGDTNFVVIHGFDTDSKGNLWALNYNPFNREYLVKLSSDSVFSYFQDPLSLTDLITRELVIDGNDTKWFTTSTVSSGSTLGTSLYFMNETRQISSSGAEGWGFLTLNDLRGGSDVQINSINSLVIDNRNELWIGTGNGVRIITNPLNPKSSVSTTRPLPGQVVNHIAVDPLNQKWIATRAGVYLLSSDGTRILEHYNESNSPLPDNNVRRIAVDQTSGKVYFGTDFGLSTLQTFSVRPNSSLGELSVYPNPINLTDGINPDIVIEGLVRDSEIKIISISGKVLKTFTTPGGGSATWDGKDENGEQVSSGIYLIVAYDKEGNNVGVTKAAVIRK